MTLPEQKKLQQQATGAVRARGVSLSEPLRAALVLLTLAAPVAVVFGAIDTARAVHVYLVAVTAIVAYAAATATLSGFGRIERRPGRRSRTELEASRPPFFERAQRRLELASTSIAQFEQLRPRLRAIAEQRLARHGLRLQSDAGRGLLGEEAWLLLAQPRQGDKFAPGPQPSELRALIDTMERI